jgi:DMSO/TMAO reductase YedYZ molybdopterin-dependent catalytic subunit
MKRPGLGWGLLLGGLFMIPLLALSWLGQQVARLAFPPFDLFDWMAVNLPSPIIGVGRATIEEIVASLQFGNSSDNAKTAENIIGVLIVLGISILVGGAFFALMNRLKGDARSSVPGLILGAIMALPFLLFTFSANLDSQADPIGAIIWVGALFIGWGFSVGWAYTRLTAPIPTLASEVHTQIMDRRRFLVQAGAATAVFTVIGAGLSSVLSRGGAIEDAPLDESVPGSSPAPDAIADASLPNAGDPVTPVPGTRAEVTPLSQHYRIDIVSNPNGIAIAEEGYVLPFVNMIGGANTPIAEITLDQLRTEFEPVEAFITMSCISNRIAGDLISTIKWTGVPMQTLLATMDVPERATHLKIHGGDQFDETISLDLIASDPRVMMCYAWADQPLTQRHGFPLRIHIPDLYGMKQPKWITRIEFIEGDQEGYWVRRGWDKEARVRTTSVIDTVATEAAYTDADGRTLIPIGGIAWAGARGISRVQVRVSGGEWMDARLRAPISDRTWSIWRYDWAFTEGEHRIEVRCFEADGTAQIDSVAGVRPSGATGIHAVRHTARGTITITPNPPLL